MALFLCAFSSAESQVKSQASSPVRSEPTVAPSEASTSYLDSVISSAVCDLDATISASYSGSGTNWANLIASPADGASQPQYDFTVTGATFTGSAGDTAAYWLMDGNDYFVHAVADSNTPLFRDMAENGSGNAWWVAMAFRPVTGSNVSYWGNGSGTGDVGMSWFANGLGDNIRVDQYSGSGTDTINNESNALSNGTDTVVIISVDMNATTNNVRSWVNTTTALQNGNVWDTNSADTNGIFMIGARSDNTDTANDIVANGTRIYHFSCGNEFLTDAKAADIFAHLETRHSPRDYTP